MYYSFKPFVEEIKLEEVKPGDIYYEKIDIVSDLFTGVYERKRNKDIIQVVYQNADITSIDLIKYHKDHYNSSDFWTLHRIADRIYELGIFMNNRIVGYVISKYDHLWREIIDQEYNEFFLLHTCRKFYYEDDNKWFRKEKIFDVEYWRLSEENYD